MKLRSLFTVRFMGPAVIGAAMLTSSGSVTTPSQVKRVALRRHHIPAQIYRKRDQTSSESYNWSGYAVTGARGSVTEVKASWVVPQVTSAACSSTPEGYSAFWVGIDGWTSSTVEQIGTDSDCVSVSGAAATPTYYAWFEFYPQAGYYIGNPDDGFKGFAVSPGDTMSAQVKSSGSGGGPRGGQRFSVTITDVTKGWTFTTSSSVPGAQQSSAEYIAETPYGCSTSTGFCPFPDFGMVDFGAQYTGVAQTSYATVNGVTQPFGSFGNNVQEAIMVSDPSAVTMATPSSIGGGGASFFVTWSNPGP